MASCSTSIATEVSYILKFINGVDCILVSTIGLSGAQDYHWFHHAHLWYHLGVCLSKWPITPHFWSILMLVPTTIGMSAASYPILSTISGASRSFNEFSFHKRCPAIVGFFIASRSITLSWQLLPHSVATTCAVVRIRVFLKSQRRSYGISFRLHLQGPGVLTSNELSGVQNKGAFKTINTAVKLTNIRRYQHKIFQVTI